MSLRAMEEKQQESFFALVIQDLAGMDRVEDHISFLVSEPCWKRS